MISNKLQTKKMCQTSLTTTQEQFINNCLKLITAIGFCRLRDKRELIKDFYPLETIKLLIEQKLPAASAE